MNKFFAGCCLLASITAANAQSIPYSIPWYMESGNAQFRQRTIDLCRNDYSLYSNSETKAKCENAETAENRLYRQRQAAGINQVETLDFWRENKQLRNSALRACARRGPLDDSFFAYCDLARKAQQTETPKIRG